MNAAIVALASFGQLLDPELDLQAVLDDPATTLVAVVPLSDTSTCWSASGVRVVPGTLDSYDASAGSRLRISSRLNWPAGWAFVGSIGMKAPTLPG